MGINGRFSTTIAVPKARLVALELAKTPSAICCGINGSGISKFQWKHIKIVNSHCWMQFTSNLLAFFFGMIPIYPPIILWMICPVRTRFFSTQLSALIDGKASWRSSAHGKGMVDTNQGQHLWVAKWPTYLQSIYAQCVLRHTVWLYVDIYDDNWLCWECHVA